MKFSRWILVLVVGLVVLAGGKGRAAPSTATLLEEAYELADDEQFDQAHTRYQQILQREPHHYAAHWARIELYQNDPRRDPGVLEREYEALEGPLAAWARLLLALRRGEQLTNRAERGETLALLERAVERLARAHPGGAWMHYLRARIARSRRRAFADEEAQAALAAAGADWLLRIAIRERLLGLEAAARAQKELGRMAERRPGWRLRPKVWLLEARAPLSGARAWDPEAFRKIIEAAPKSRWADDARWGLIQSAYRAKISERVFARTRTLDGRLATVRRLRHPKTSRVWREYKSLIDEIIARGWTNTTFRAYHHYVEVCKVRGAFAEGLKYCLAYERAYPEQRWQLYTETGDCLRALGRLAKAAEYYGKNRADRGRFEKMAQCHFERGDYDRALGLYQAHARLQSGQADATPDIADPQVIQCYLLAFPFAVASMGLVLLVGILSVPLSVVVYAGHYRFVRHYTWFAVGLAGLVFFLEAWVAIWRPGEAAVSQWLYLGAGLPRLFWLVGAGSWLAAAAGFRSYPLIRGWLRRRRGGPRRNWPRLLGATALALVVMIAVTAALWILARPVRSELLKLLERMNMGPKFDVITHPAGQLHVAIPAVISAGVVEELVCRLFFLSLLVYYLRRVRHGRLIAIVVTSFFWAIAHAGMVSPEWFKLAQVFSIGIILSWLMMRQGIGCCVLAHAGFNALAITVKALIESSGG